MQVGIVIKSNVLDIGGMSKVAFNMAKYAPKTYQVTILDINKTYGVKVRQEAELEGIDRVNAKHIRLVDDNTAHGFNINSVISLMLSRESQSKAANCDMIYFTTNILSFSFRKHKNQTFVGSTHGLFYLSGNGMWSMISRMAGYIAYRKLDAIHELFLGQSKAAGLDRPSFVVPNGIDTNIFKPASLETVMQRNQYCFLFVGRLEDCKGIKIAVEAFKRADSQRKHRMIIVGSGPLADYVRENEAPNITYIGAVSEKTLAEIYRACDVLLTPTTCDSFPLVVLEALSSGLYVLASDLLRPIWEEHSRNVGIEFVLPDIAAFETAIRNIMNGGKKWDRRRQYDYIREKFDINIVVRKLFDEMHRIHDEIH